MSFPDDRYTIFSYAAQSLALVTGRMGQTSIRFGVIFVVGEFVVSE